MRFSVTKWNFWQEREGEVSIESYQTSKPTQKEWSWFPHCFAPLFPATWRAVTDATREESRPPDSRTPKGTSVISLLRTAWTEKRNGDRSVLHVEILFETYTILTYVLKRLSENKGVVWSRRDRLREPRRAVPSSEIASFAGVQISGREIFEMLAIVVQSFHLRWYPNWPCRA